MSTVRSIKQFPVRSNHPGAPEVTDGGPRLASSVTTKLAGRKMTLVGQRFGRLTVTAEAPPRLQRSGVEVRHWHCRCDCGNERAVCTGSLRSGHTASCGCLHSETTTARSLRHGAGRRGQRTPEYICWKAMRRRCNCVTGKDFKDYGGRGITVCERWDNFENFLADMGTRPTARHSIDRIDVNGNYEPGNCRWATAKQQRNNRRDSRCKH